MKGNILIKLVFLILLAPLLAFAQGQELPELGDSSALSLTPEQERQIGRDVVRRMRQAGYLINDPLVSEYVEQLGRSLAVHTQGGQSFTFFVVDAPSINAFALPGGYIGLHSGLIIASQNESELASVVAHEIAHVTQHHLARGVEQANRMQLPLSMAMIAAILLSGGDPNIINAAVAATVGGAEQMRLNFTRSHEHEADRVGMQLLAGSEFDPRGMADFFSRLQQESRYYGEGIPEFLQTHPITSARMAEAQSAAAHYPRKMHPDNDAYLVARARLRLHHSSNAARLLQELESAGGTSAIDNYQRAITLIALQQTAKAQALLEKLLTQAPHSIAYRETLGELLYEQGNHKRAIKLYQHGLQRYPGNPLLTLSLVQNLLATKQYQRARPLLQGLLRHHPESARGYNLLAELESAQGNKAASHLARAEYYRLLDEPHSALEQLNIAKRSKGNDFYHLSRIEALNREIIEALGRERNANDRQKQ